MKQRDVLRKVIALALMRWHGRLEPEVVREADNLAQVTFHSWPQVMFKLEALDRNIDWSIVWSSLLKLTAEQLFELLSQESLTVDDITAAGAVSAIERLWEE
jgi:hypothetical protein